MHSYSCCSPGPGDGGVEVDALVERVDLDAGLRAARQRSLGALARCAQASHAALVVRNVLLVLALELLNEVVHHSVVEVLACTRKMHTKLNFIRHSLSVMYHNQK